MTRHCLKWGPLPQNEVVGLHSMSGRDKEGKDLFITLGTLFEVDDSLELLIFLMKYITSLG